MSVEPLKAGKRLEINDCLCRNEKMYLALIHWKGKLKLKIRLESVVMTLLADEGGLVMILFTEVLFFFIELIQVYKLTVRKSHCPLIFS